MLIKAIVHKYYGCNTSLLDSVQERQNPVTKPPTINSVSSKGNSSKITTSSVARTITSNQQQQVSL